MGWTTTMRMPPDIRVLQGLMVKSPAAQVKGLAPGPATHPAQLPSVRQLEDVACRLLF